MKRLQLILIPCMVFSLLSAVQKASGQAATSVVVEDTRNGDSLPNAYSRAAYFDFKYRSVIHAPGSATYNGLMTLAPWSDNSGGPVYQVSFDPAGLYLRTGSHATSAWSSWSRFVIESPAGLTKLGDGSANAGLEVNGDVKAREVTVTTTGWPDYVFDKDYELPSLDTIEKQIRSAGHLPGMPSASEVACNGQALGDMNKKLLQQVEELTLYLIQQKKAIEQQNSRISKQGAVLEQQKELVKQQGILLAQQRAMLQELTAQKEW